MSARSSSDGLAAVALFAAGGWSVAAGLALLAVVLVAAAFPFAVAALDDQQALT